MKKSWKQHGWVVCFREGKSQTAIVPVPNQKTGKCDSFTGYGELFFKKGSAREAAKELAKDWNEKEDIFVRTAVLTVGETDSFKEPHFEGKKLVKKC